MEMKNYFYCLKKSEQCNKDFFGNIACSDCLARGNCNYCGRKNTSFCEKCVYQEVERKENT